MNPWFFFWAPQLTMPFGSVAQRIEPDTTWFCGARTDGGGSSDRAQGLRHAPTGASWD